MINIYNVVYLFIFAPLIVALFEILVKILQKKPLRWLFFGLNAISSAFCLFLSSLSAQWYLTYAPRVLEDNSAIYLIKNILIYFGFYVDGLSIIFASFSALVFFLVNISSFRFMQENPQGYARFYIYLNLLQFFTIGFILSSNLVQSTIFSIFLGLCVYLFSNFYFQKPAAQRYSKYVFQINVISEIFLLSAMTVFLYFGTNAIDTITTPTLGYNNINSMGLYSCAGLNPFLFGFMTILLIASALIKSAQVPFSSKVHFVSNAPNPAYSAIIVPIIMGEGFYLILRCAPLINLAPISFEIIKITGLISAILGALIAFKENEIKKIFAFLTVSQLGIAGILIGFKLFSAAVFYMVSSSICILLLSLICDAINYATLGQESIKFLGGLRKNFQTWPLALYSVHFLYQALFLEYLKAKIQPFWPFKRKKNIFTFQF